MKRVLIGLATIGLLFGTGHSNAVDDTEVALVPNTKLPAQDRTSVRRVPRQNIMRVSRQIDVLIEAELWAQGQHRNAAISDEVFLRRIYLDIIGRIPSLAETRSFLADETAARRARLIDRLLDSPGYVNHQFNYWADVLRVKDRVGGGGGYGAPYIDFIKRSLCDNQPYDEFVRQLISAEGPLLADGNGAVGYYLRDFGMPEDNMSNTVRVFLGTRLECAQCHDHPFDVWTQHDYFQMVAFTGGVETRLRNMDTPHAEALRELSTDKTLAAEERRLMKRMAQPLGYGVAGSGTGLARLPEGYQYDDGEPLEIVTAETIFTDEALVDPQPPVGRKGRKPKVNKRRPHMIPGAAELDSRRAYAEWMTSPNNPRFSMVIANRLWRRTMGRGIAEPVDDITEETEPCNVALLEFLTKQIVALGYDMRQFQRAIYNSRTYQSIAVKQDLDSEKGFYFPGPLLRRMTGEQLWDSLVTLTVEDVDRQDGLKQRYGYRMSVPYDQLRTMTPQQMLAEVRAEMNGERRKSRDMMNEMQSAADRKQRLRNRDRQRELRQQLSRARRAKNTDQEEIARLEKRLQAAIAAARTRFGKQAKDLRRAADLPSPARPGHFIREFGQSDREQIENANSDPAVTQVLSLMNGFIENRIVNNPYTLLMKNVQEAASPAEQVDVVFLSMINRHPRPAESKVWLDGDEDLSVRDIRDLIWVLANTHEFMFVQ